LFLYICAQCEDRIAPLRWTVLSFCSIAHAVRLLGNADEVAIELAIAVRVLVCRRSVITCRQAFELNHCLVADGLYFAHLCRLFQEIRLARVERHSHRTLGSGSVLYLHRQAMSVLGAALRQK